MKIVLSPAMNMKNSEDINIEKTVPIFKEKTIDLVEYLKRFNPFELESQLDLSPKLLKKVFEYYQEFDCKEIESKGTQAILSFQGLAYKNINAFDFSRKEWEFAKNNIRILSGLYGILKATDIIQPYSLDFISNFAKKGLDDVKLYEYWGKEVYKELFKKNEIVIGICSKEYEKLFLPYLKPMDKYIKCDFLIKSDGKFKTNGTIAKILRGQMARYIVKNKIDNVEELKAFTFDKFNYSEYYSKEDVLVFIQE